MVRARKQIVKPVGPQKCDSKPKQEYNIWYNKYSGSRNKPGEERTKAATRCNTATDAGETRGTHRDDAGICLNFARGCCPLGYDCSWLHEIPKGNVCREGTMRDCFGRERHENVRDDQSGIGSFVADDETSRTLYIGGIVRTSAIQSVVHKHFNEWGDVENIRVLDSKGVAFVRYKNRANAEFAMEAMQRQSLDNNEVLNVRWATEDPNPWTQNRKENSGKRKLLDIALDSGKMNPDLVEHDLPSKRKPNTDMNEATGFYPNTDYLYISGGACDHHRQKSPPSPPKTLSDLVAWSQKQAAAHSKHLETNINKESTQIDSTRNSKPQPDKQTVLSLVCEYSSSSEED
jgi:hypothetical protein